MTTIFHCFNTVVNIELQLRHMVAKQMRKIVTTVVGAEQNKYVHDILHGERFDLTNFVCYEKVARHFSQNCFSIALVST